MRALLLCAVLALLPAPAVQAQAILEPELAPVISVVTFSPGQIYWQRFGHNALVVREPLGPPRLYNYGVFDFEQKNFFLNFARGRMLYRLYVSRLDETLYQYHQEGRWAYEQQLALTATQARSLAQFLDWNARPQNAEYRYDYFADNCSTRVRDAIDRALSGALRPQLEARAAGRSLRFEATRLIAPDLPLALAMDLAMGPRADQPLDVWQQSFAPLVLMEALREARNGAAPLVAREGWLLQLDVPPPPAAPRRFPLAFALLGLGLAALLLIPALHRVTSPLAAGLGAFTGLGGAVLALGWLATEHWAMQANRNLLLVNPLWLLLVPALWRGTAASSTARCIAAVLAAAAVAGVVAALWPHSAQEQGQWLGLWVPLNLALAWRLLKAQSR